MILGFALGFVGGAGAACPVSRTVEELRASLDAVDAAWGGDTSAFSDAVGTTRAILPCVATEVDAATAAHLHRAEGLDAFLHRDGEGARRAFAAARATDPSWTLPDSMAPAGNPLRAEWAALPPVPPTAPFYAPDPTGTRVDGVPGTARPDDRPVVLQHLGADGRSDLAVWLAAGQPTPWGDAPAPGPTRSRAKGWWTATAATLATSGALYGAGAIARYGWYDESETAGQANERRPVVNDLVYVSAGVAAVGLGLGAVSLVVTLQ